MVGGGPEKQIAIVRPKLSVDKLRRFVQWIHRVNVGPVNFFEYFLGLDGADGLRAQATPDVAVQQTWNLTTTQKSTVKLGVRMETVQSLAKMYVQRRYRKSARPYAIMAFNTLKNSPTYLAQGRRWGRQRAAAHPIQSEHS